MKFDVTRIEVAGLDGDTSTFNPSDEQIKKIQDALKPLECMIVLSIHLGD
jgi:hypothetical protein